MRFSQLLLEYDRSKMIEKYTANKVLYNRLTHDRSFANIRAQMILFWSDERRRILDRTLDQVLCTRFLQEVEQADPTPNKMYSAWIITRYLSGGINLFEDIGQCEGPLEQFHSAKMSGYFRRHPEHAQYADIGRLKSLNELNGFLAVINPADLMSNSAQDKALDDELKRAGEVLVLYNGPKYRIVQPDTLRAAQFYGRNTQWCTAAKKNPLFQRYNDQGPLFIILDKPNNRRWQFHFESAQFMDERDVPINWAEFPQEIWSLLDWKQYMGKLDMEGCATLLAACPETYLEFLLDESDSVAMAVGYAHRPDKPPLRNAIVALGPLRNERVSRDGYDLTIYADAAYAFVNDLKFRAFGNIWNIPAGKAATKNISDGVFEFMRMRRLVVIEHSDQRAYICSEVGLQITVQFDDGASFRTSRSSFIEDMQYDGHNLGNDEIFKEILHILQQDGVW